VLNLGEVGVGVALVDKRVKEFGCLPNTHLAFVERKVLFLLSENKTEGLVRVIGFVKLSHSRHHGCIVVAEFCLTFAFTIAAGNELAPAVFDCEAIGGCVWNYGLHGNTSQLRKHR
jgi:hypothetical protein